LLNLFVPLYHLSAMLMPQPSLAVRMAHTLKLISIARALLQNTMTLRIT
jgi:hypothetical protein